MYLLLSQTKGKYSVRSKMEETPEMGDRKMGLPSVVLIKSYMLSKLLS